MNSEQTTTRALSPMMQFTIQNTRPQTDMTVKTATKTALQHVCPVRTCNKSFSTSGNLSRHKRLHGYIEPLPCPVAGCVCTFTSNNKLAKHMRFHFGSDDVKVCAVVGCGKTFSTTGNLNRHLKAAHDYDSDAVSTGSCTPRSECGSPVWLSRPSLCMLGSPTGADQWLAHAPVSRVPEWPVAPISFTAPQESGEWDSDLADILAALFEHDASEVDTSGVAN